MAPSLREMSRYTKLLRKFPSRAAWMSWSPQMFSKVRVSTSDHRKPLVVFACIAVSLSSELRGDGLWWTPLWIRDVWATVKKNKKKKPKTTDNPKPTTTYWGCLGCFVSGSTDASKVQIIPILKCEDISGWLKPRRLCLCLDVVSRRLCCGSAHARARRCLRGPGPRSVHTRSCQLLDEKGDTSTRRSRPKAKLNSTNKQPL